MRFVSCTAASIFVVLFQHTDWIIDPESMKRSIDVSKAGRNILSSRGTKIIT
jgi:hypothetical protein